MVNFDLIPNEYKYWLWQKVCLQRLAIFIVVSVVALLSLSFYWHLKAQQLQTVTTDLQSQLARTQVQQNQLENLIQTQIELEAQWHLLSGLRGGTTVETILITIDQALNEGNVWFLDWQFKRLGQEAALQIAAQQNGFNSEQSNELGQVNTQISIRGQAKDHSAFSAFVQKLIINEGIVDVKIVRTNLNQLNNINVIDFDILVLIKNTLEVKHV